MFQASDIGQYGIEDFTFWGGGGSLFPNPWDFGFGGISPFDFSLGGAIGAITGINIPQSAGAYVPPVVISEIPVVVNPVDIGREQISKGPDVLDDEALEELLEQRRILEEIIAQSPVGTGTLEPIDEERWGEIIRLPVPVSVDDQEFEEEAEMAHTWLHAGTQIAESIFGGNGEPTVYDTGTGFVPMGTGDPTYNGTAFAAAAKKKGCRRRRRRLLTDRDFDDLNRISTLPNNQNVRTVLAKAIGRR